MSTTTKRDGVLTIENGRLVFYPEVYPVNHLANEGWRKEGEKWTAPLVPDYARQLRALFPSTAYSDTFMEWIEQLGGKGAAPTHLLAPHRPPKWEQLFPYQQRAAEWLAQRRSAILCLAPGLGKSAVALTALQMALPKRNADVVIVCPLTLIGTWQEQAARWYPDAAVVVHHGAHLARQGQVSSGEVAFGVVPRGLVRSGTGSVGEFPTLHLLTYDGLRLRGLPIERPDVLLLDESVLIKNRFAARTKAAWKARKHAQLAWELSGSPCTRFYDDLYAQLACIAPQEYRSYWRFTNAVCLTSDTIWGRQVVANVPNIEEKLKHDLAPVAYFYNYSDLAKEEPERAIPEWTFETRKVPLPPAWWRLYRAMQDKFVAELPDGHRVLAPNTLARLVRLLQLASHPALLSQEQPDDTETGNLESGETDPLDFSVYDWSTKGGKLGAIPSLLEELPGPTIIWTNFIATAKHLSSTLKAPMLIGETPAEERTQIVAAFQRGAHPVLIAHPGVGRFGLTLTRGRSMIFAERSHNADFYYQALYRCRRIGTTEPPQVVHLEATGPNGERTVDYLVDKVLRYRKERSEALTAQTVREALQ